MGIPTIAQSPQWSSSLLLSFYRCGGESSETGVNIPEVTQQSVDEEGLEAKCTDDLPVQRWDRGQEETGLN